MALDREKGVIHNVNRIVIAGISIIASLLDAISLSDLLFAMAIILWLWLPECDRLEERLYDYYKNRRSSISDNKDE